MKVQNARLIAAGQALKAVDAASVGPLAKQVVGVDVDGVTVDADKAKLKHAAAERQAERNEQKTELPKVVDKMVAKAAPSVDKTVNVMGKVGLGVVANEVMRHTEHVQRTFTVGLTFDDGTRFEVPVQVTDKRASHLLQRLTLAVEAITVVPFSGMFVRPAVVVGSLLASVHQRLFGDKDVAKALENTARKSLVLAVADVVPGVGTATGILATVGGSKNAAALNAVPVATIAGDPFGAGPAPTASTP